MWYQTTDGHIAWAIQRRSEGTEAVYLRGFVIGGDGLSSLWAEGHLNEVELLCDVKSPKAWPVIRHWKGEQAYFVRIRQKHYWAEYDGCRFNYTRLMKCPTVTWTPFGEMRGIGKDQKLDLMLESGYKSNLADRVLDHGTRMEILYRTTQCKRLSFD